jgi:hypothetical protein
VNFWIVQFRRTRRAHAEARLFVTWNQAMRYVNRLSVERRIPLYMKPIVFQVTRREN